MAVEITSFLLLATALGLGLRHGMDFDHLAALMDIASTQPRPKRAFGLGLTYAIGHSSIVAALGVVAILAGLALPESVQRPLALLVGVTLIILGAWVIFLLWKNGGKPFQLRGRWILMADGMLRLYGRLRARVTGKEAPIRKVLSGGYGVTSAYAVGIIHGVGAETPTQMVLFILAAGVGSAAFGGLLVISWVAGLFVTMTIVSAVLAVGYNHTTRRPAVFMGIALLTGLLSLAVGSLVLMEALEILSWPW